MSIKVKNLSYVYSPKTPYEHKALEGITFTIEEGETVGIIGSTGSGKSTLVQHFNALIKLQEGELMVNGFDLAAKKINYKALRRDIGMLFQYPEYQLFEDTVAKDVAFGPKNFGFKKEEIDFLVKEALTLVGLDYDEVKDKSPFELSGGEKRRVAIAGVIASRPKVLVLDEPTAGLDPVGKREILELIHNLKNTYVKTVIMISHNMDEIAEFTDRVIVLNERYLIHSTTPEKLFSDQNSLNGTGLRYPHVVRIQNLLKEKGVDIELEKMTVDSLIDEIENKILK
ncbi:MAG: energy-coupling factor transporter ATPase [Christensenellales bacterium]|jgi:energy-coupling factor transport system ATP-binding protein|nr:energy-coupling factor transporter ATPase [Clostridiales bacterium]